MCRAIRKCNNKPNKTGVFVWTDEYDELTELVASLHLLTFQTPNLKALKKLKSIKSIVGISPTMVLLFPVLFFY